jgi:hypothetical protein
LRFIGFEPTQFIDPSSDICIDLRIPDVFKLKFFGTIDTPKVIEIKSIAVISRYIELLTIDGINIEFSPPSWAMFFEKNPITTKYKFNRKVTKISNEQYIASGKRALEHYLKYLDWMNKKSAKHYATEISKSVLSPIELLKNGDYLLFGIEPLKSYITSEEFFRLKPTIRKDREIDNSEYQLYCHACINNKAKSFTEACKEALLNNENYWTDDIKKHIHCGVDKSDDINEAVEYLRNSITKKYDKIPELSYQTERNFNVI